ncbi:MAG: shikimate dehydrogenase [Candidatus Competibacteraceae bacterium]|jgi:shikimate dehydrogenase|nr:shikimate dehydrogenase [Candidatus Competibacteraceae bacterium]
MNSSKPDQYAVIGNPISHSQSPRIHSIFAVQTGQNLEYQAILAEPGHFSTTVNAFRENRGRGLNVTVPFKQEAWIYADLLSTRAERARAVNTLVFQEDGVAFGENTDGIGLVKDIKDNHNLELAGQRILLLGAGGAARGILQPLLNESPARLVIANRTPAKALELALMFTDLGSVTGCGLDELAGQRFDVIINATAAGLSDSVPALPDGVLASDGWCYDLMYGDEPTAFVSWARQQGAARWLDGLGMLVEQAAESFSLWRGIRPDTQLVIATLRNVAGRGSV